MDIVDFPDFTKLKIEHKATIDKFVGGFEAYSDFNFTSLFSWDTDGVTAVSILNNNLVIKMADYTSDRTIYSLLGNHSVDESIKYLLAAAGQLSLVPEETVQAIKKRSDFRIAESRGHFDYIYDVKELINLTGNKHRKKRHKINSVSRTFSDSLLVDNSNCLDTARRRKIEAIFEAWKEHSEQAAAQLQSESAAIGRLLDHAQRLNLLYTIVSNGSEPVGFSINETLPNGYAVCHFEKAAPVHHHIFSYVAHQAAEYLLGQGCSFVNWEQDLSIEGLRQSKMAYHPTRFLKKYTVSMAEPV